MPHVQCILHKTQQTPQPSESSYSQANRLFSSPIHFYRLGGRRALIEHYAIESFNRIFSSARIPIGPTKSHPKRILDAVVPNSTQTQDTHICRYLHIRTRSSCKPNNHFARITLRLVRPAPSPHLTLPEAKHQDFPNAPTSQLYTLLLKLLEHSINPNPRTNVSATRDSQI